MELLRRQYLDRLRRLLDAPAITAVTGIRRAGKSVLLRAVSWRIWFSWSCAVAATR